MLRWSSHRAKHSPIEPVSLPDSAVGTGTDGEMNIAVDIVWRGWWRDRATAKREEVGGWWAGLRRY